MSTVATSLPDHLHFYCFHLFKGRITTKEKLKRVKVFKLRKIHFR